MFRRQEHSLPTDAKYPTNLKELGFFIDESPSGVIRNIKAPERFFDHLHTNNDRHNDVRQEAFNECVRREMLQRLVRLGFKRLFMPTLTNIPPDGPHVAILSPEAHELKSKKRVIVVINDDCSQDLGTLAWRVLRRNGGINEGSIINFVKEISKRTSDQAALPKNPSEVSEEDAKIPGLLMLNTGQLWYSHKHRKTLSLHSWNALPRKSICHDAIVLDPIENRVEGHRTSAEHVRSVFDQVIGNPDLVSPDAEIYVIAIENGSEVLLQNLEDDFERYGKRIRALAIVQSPYLCSQVSNPFLKSFLHRRARQWKIVDSDCVDPQQCVELPSDYRSECADATAGSKKPIDWLDSFDVKDTARIRDPTTSPVTAEAPESLDNQEMKPHQSASINGFLESEDALCPTFPSATASVGETIFTQASVQNAVLDFFEIVAQDPANFFNPLFELSGVVESYAEHPIDLTVSQDVMLMEHPAVSAAKSVLHGMYVALEVTPASTELIASRERLEKRIQKKEAEIRGLERKVEAEKEELLRDERKDEEDVDGGKKADESGLEEKENGTSSLGQNLVSSEDMEGAGFLNDVVEEELARLKMKD